MANSINQGEQLIFKGSFQQKLNGQWSIVDLTPDTYIVDALIVNERSNKTYMFSSVESTDVGTITISNNTYQFVLTKEQTSKMLGDCTIEVSLSTIKEGKRDDTIITDNKGSFVIQESLLGRLLTNKK